MKSWQDWATPVEDFFIPWYQNWISKSPVAAITLGTAIGSLFGSTRYGRVMGAAIGGLSSAVGVSYVNTLEAATGEKWIPERRRKEREVEEYFDVLKYVKYRGLYEQAADEALKREGFDVRAYVKRNQMEGDARKTRTYKLQQEKRQLMLDGKSESERMKEINQELNELQNTRKAEKITPIAAQAIQFYQESERTMYAYDPGDPLENILSALPRKDRLYFNKFLNAPEEERDDILEIVPGYVRRALQSMWGLSVDEKPELEEYFTHYNLPNADWMGWDPRADLSDIKLRVIKHEGMDIGEHNMWPEDEARANQIKDSQVPSMIQETHIGVVKNRLRDILGQAGFKNLQVEVEPTKEQGIFMDVNVNKDRRSEIQHELNENGYSLI